MDFSTTRFPVHHQLPEPTQIHVNRIGDTIQPSHPLSSLFLLLSIFHSIRIFSNELVLLTRWPKYWSFSFRSVLPMNIRGWFPSGLTGWISLQSKKLRSLLQHHSSKASILWRSAFFTVQLSHMYMTTGNTRALTIRIVVGKVMSLLFNTLSRFVVDNCTHFTW